MEDEDQQREARRQQIVDSLLNAFNSNRPIMREVAFDDIAGEQQ